MNAFHAISLGVLLIPAAMLKTDGCHEPPTEPSCDRIDLTMQADGYTTVVNHNDTAITFSLEIWSSRCDSSRCTWTGSYPKEALDAGTTGNFSADNPPEVCLEVYCCDTGWVGDAEATLTLDNGCTLTATAEKKTCNGP